MSQTAAELRSGLLRLSSSPDCDFGPGHGNGGLCRVLSAALPQLVQSCADAMEVGSSEDDWAGAEASLFEALVQVTSLAPCESASDLDFQLQEDAFGSSHQLSASPEEQRDQAALQKLLGRLDALSQQLELEAPKHRSSQNNASSGPGSGQPTNAASNSFGASATRLADLEAQVQCLVAENQAGVRGPLLGTWDCLELSLCMSWKQALEEQLSGRFSEPEPPSKAIPALDRVELPPGPALARDAGATADVGLAVLWEHCCSRPEVVPSSYLAHTSEPQPQQPGACQGARGPEQQCPAARHPLLSQPSHCPAI